MIVYRIGPTKYANLINGEGARLNGGRWNQLGTPCIYASESRALALLEYTVNVNIEEIPRALSVITFDIPDDRIMTLLARDLPDDSKDWPAPPSTKQFGTALFNEGKSLVYKIPSVIIPDEWNFIINPLHPVLHKIKIVHHRDFIYDIRIKTI